MVADYSVSALENARLKQAEILQRDTLARMSVDMDAHVQEWQNIHAEGFDAMDGHVTAYYDHLEAQNQKAAESIAYFADSMSAAFADFVTTGKFSFKDFANSIINDLIRIQTRALLAEVFSSATGSGGAPIQTFRRSALTATIQRDRRTALLCYLYKIQS